MAKPSIQTFSLEAARADGWLERLGEGQPAFGKLCEIIGEHFVAFSVIAGVRITAIALDARSPERSMVDFSIGDDGPTQRLSLADLRRKLGEVVMTDTTPEPTGRLPASPSIEELQARIGFRWVLLAPIYGYELRQLHVDAGGATSFTLGRDGTSLVMSLEELKEALRSSVRVDMTRAAASRVAAPFSIDLSLVPQVLQAAAQSEHERVIDLIGAWPGPLSVLMRTAEGQGLAPDARAALSRALGALGTAHAKLGRIEWGQEVLRLGIQWAQDGTAAGELFARLGRLALEGQRPGESIGLLRRALSLGAEPALVLPSLARAFVEQGRMLPALVLVERARALGIRDTELEEAANVAMSGPLGAPFSRWRAAEGGEGSA